MATLSEPCIERIRASAYRIPTDAPESDGTFAWNDTVMVLVEALAGGERGLGYSYTAETAAALVREVLTSQLVGYGAFDVAACWARMRNSVRNLGYSGLCATAIAAVDTALWDLKARLLQVSLLDLFGAVRTTIPIYGSGGFTSYDDARLTSQLLGWTEQGIRMVKMKVGRCPAQDVPRVSKARQALGSDVQLFVDANGAFDVQQAISFAQRVRDAGVCWFEEPVSSDDLTGLRFVREHTPGGMHVSAGEYGYDEFYFLRMLQAQAVDVLQADATRCGGFTGFFQADALSAAFNRPLSSHCAPALHVHACCAARSARHLEYFHDHVRIERLFFDGVLEPVDGCLQPDRSCDGHGLVLRERDASRFRVS